MEPSGAHPAIYAQPSKRMEKPVPPRVRQGWYSRGCELYLQPAAHTHPPGRSRWEYPGAALPRILFGLEFSGRSWSETVRRVDPRKTDPRPRHKKQFLVETH